MKRIFCFVLGAGLVVAWALLLELFHAWADLPVSTFETMVRVGDVLWSRPDLGALLWVGVAAFFPVALAAPQIESFFWHIARMVLVAVVVGFFSYEATFAVILGNPNATTWGGAPGFREWWGLLWGCGMVGPMAILAGLAPGGQFFYIIERRYR